MPTSSRKIFLFFFLRFSPFLSMFLRLLTSSLPARNLKEIRLKLRWGWVCETRILFSPL